MIEQLTDAQITKAFEGTIGMAPREADLQVVRMLGGTAENTALYIWDHWLGEPTEPTYAEVLAQVRKVAT